MKTLIKLLDKLQIEFTLLPNNSIQIKRNYLNYDFNKLLTSMGLNIFYLDTTAIIY